MLTATELSTAALSPDGAHLVTACFDGTFALWQTATGKLLRRWQRPKARGVLRWSPDNTHLAFRSFRPDGAYTVTALNPLTGAARIVADLDPDDGASLGFDWAPNGRTLIFADTEPADGTTRGFLSVVPLSDDEALTELPREQARRRVEVPRGVPLTRVFATRTGFFCAHVGEAAVLGLDGTVLWAHPTASDDHAMSPARNAVLSFHQTVPHLRRILGEPVALEASQPMGNQRAWSVDGSHLVLNASLAEGAGYAVFREHRQVAAVPDAQPLVPRTFSELGYFYLDGWSNIALNGTGSHFVLADNETGELRGWALGPSSKLLWSAELDDLSFVQWNGSTIIAASATQVMFVDGASGRILARGNVAG